MLARIGFLLFFWEIPWNSHTLGRPYEERRTLGMAALKHCWPTMRGRKQPSSFIPVRGPLLDPYVDPLKDCRVSLRFSSFSLRSRCWVFFVEIYQDDGTIDARHPLATVFASSGADDASMLSVLKRKQSVSCIAQLRQSWQCLNEGRA